MINLSDIFKCTNEILLGDEAWYIKTPATIQPEVPDNWVDLASHTDEDGKTYRLGGIMDDKEYASVVNGIVDIANGVRKDMNSRFYDRRPSYEVGITDPRGFFGSRDELVRKELNKRVDLINDSFDY